MTTNAETRRGLTGGSQEAIFAVGAEAAAATIAQPTVARPVLVATSGRTEYAVRCPGCRAWHRHTSLGEKTAPCGSAYLVEPRRGRVGRAA